MKLIGIVDYGLGNLQSIKNAINHLGFKYIITSDKKLLEDSDGIILPGVGSYKIAMKNIKNKKLDIIITDLINSYKPCLATCLGMQILFEKSYEFGETQGLGILNGEVKKLSNLNIGWKKIKTTMDNKHELFDNKYFYFIHSFYVSMKSKNIHSYSFFNDFKFCSSIYYKKTLATQFHLEKSGINGLNVIDVFFNERF